MVLGWLITKRSFRKDRYLNCTPHSTRKHLGATKTFRQVRVKFNWGAYSIAEQLPADLGSVGSHSVVEEGSAKHDTDYYNKAHADHFSICRPTFTNDTSFCKLRDAIHRTKSRMYVATRLPLQLILWVLMTRSIEFKDQRALCNSRQYHAKQSIWA